MQTESTPVSRAALLLASCALLAALLLEGTHWLTREPIAEARRQAELAALNMVLPRDRYDNDLLNDRITLLAPRWLGSAEPLTLRRARLREQPSALVLEAVAADGYSGPIRLLLAIDQDQRVLGVRITEHRETPGLGDAIEASRSNWIGSFEQRSLADPALPAWRVKKDGGEFDQFAGATVTPRAVVGAVRRALQMVERHHQSLMTAPVDSVMELHDGPDA